MTLVPVPDADVLGALEEVEVDAELAAAVPAHVARAVDRLDPERGTLLAAVWLRPRPARACCCWPRTSWRWTPRRGG